jgi:hypothetical protein
MYCIDAYPRIETKSLYGTAPPLETNFWVKILKFFDADPGWKTFGSEINIPDPQHCVRILLYSEFAVHYPNESV